jgi:hypothetical protein|uniref:Ribosomal protein L10 n=1 Tax=Baffinella frigidus TaxID=2571260 RepID=A0A6C0X6E1_9CRYP|nr:hypothetical protein [Cryptophyta sp. CCMP2293]
MNYSKKKHLLLIKWVNIILPKFDFFIICYKKPLHTKNYLELRKNFKNIKKISSSNFKCCVLFNEISNFRIFSGKLTIVYFSNINLKEIKQFLDIVEKQKILVPLLYFHSNRFITTSEVLIKNQLKRYSYISHINLSAKIFFVNFSYQKVLLFYMQNIYTYLIIKNEK